MGVNLDKVRERQAREDAREAARQAGGIRYWSPERGENPIRLLPPWTSEGAYAGEFSREVYMHWRVGEGDNQRSFMCPAKSPNVGGVCPVCDYVSKLRDTGDPADTELAGEWAAKQQFYSNIIDLKDPTFTKKDYDLAKSRTDDVGFSVGDTKVKVFRYGPMIYKQLLDNFCNAGFDFTDPESGRGLIIKKTGQGKTGTSYNVMLDINPSPLVLAGGNTLDKIMYDLEATLVPREAAEMAALLPGGSPLPATSPPPALSAPESEPHLTAPVYPTEAETDDDDDDGPPECFKDSDVFNVSDPICVGGAADDGETYEQCPYYQECGTAVGVIGAKKRRRRTSTKVESPVGPAEALEDEMAAHLRAQGVAE